MPLDGDTFRGPDTKPAKRVKNPKAMKAVHEKGCFCVLNCGKKGETHHIIFKAQGGPDETWNLCCLCVNHHGLIHTGDVPTLTELGEHLLLGRPDSIEGILAHFGDKGEEWLKRHLHISV